MIKKNICIFLIFLLNFFLFGHTNYYWENGEKNNLKLDKSSIAIYVYENKRIDLLKDFNSNIKEISKNQVDNVIIVNLFRPIDIRKSDFSSLNVKNIRYAFIDAFGNKKWLTNKIICKPKLAQSKDIQKIFNEKMLKITKKSSLGTIEIEIENIKNVIRIANELYETGLFEWSHPDFLISVKRTSLPWEKQYYLNNKSQFSVNAFEGWEYELGSSEIKVAVIDDGVENHVDLCDNNGNTRVLNGYTPSGITLYGRPDTGDSHGQACAGIIAASHSSNIRGIAPEINLLPVKIRYGEGIPASEYADAINWAWQNGADVLSNSWGGGGLDDNLRNAIENAKSLGRNGKGSVVVWASGNDGFNSVDAKAKISIAVGAINRNGFPASMDDERYTNIGPNQDLVAFGGNVYDGEGDIRTIDREGNAGYNSGKYTDHFSGTSSACPQVSGAAALLLSINPNLRREQVENLLFTTAIDMGNTGKDNTYGFGRLNIFSAILETYKTINQNFGFNEGKLGMTRVEKNKKWTIIQGNGEISAGLYFVDVYKASKTIENSSDKVYYMGSGAFKANPYYNEYWSKISNNSGKTTIETYFIHVKYNLAGNSVNKFLPQHPNSKWARTYLAGVPKIVTSNVVINNGEKLELNASEKIIFKSGFHAKEGSEIKTNLINYP